MVPERKQNRTEQVPETEVSCALSEANKYHVLCWQDLETEHKAL